MFWNSYLYGRWCPREHCFIGWNCFCTSEELIHYNFSAEWAIQTFMLALCILFTDIMMAHMKHIWLIISSQMEVRGGLSGSYSKNTSYWDKQVFKLFCDRNLIIAIEHQTWTKCTLQISSGSQCCKSELATDGFDIK